MKFVTLSRAIVACIALAVSSVSFAEEKEKEKDKKEEKKSEQKLSAADKAWVQMAAMSDLCEIRLAKAAQDKASSEQIKQHAAQMLKDHTATSTELKRLAKEKDIDLKTELPEAKKEVIEEITSKSGDEFDQSYMAAEVVGHRMAATHFQNGAEFLKDQELQAFAQKYLPIIEQHRAMVEKEAGRTTQTQQPGQQQPATGTAGARPQQPPQPGQQQPPQQQQQQQPSGQVRTE